MLSVKFAFDRVSKVIFSRNASVYLLTHFRQLFLLTFIAHGVSCVFFCRLWNTAYVDVNIQPSPEDLRAAIQFSGCPDRLQ